MAAAVVADVDAPPVLEAAEHDFEPVELPVEGDVLWDRVIAAPGGGDAGGCAALAQVLAQAGAVVAAVVRRSTPWLAGADAASRPRRGGRWLGAGATA